MTVSLITLLGWERRVTPIDSIFKRIINDIEDHVIYFTMRRNVLYIIITEIT